MKYRFSVAILILITAACQPNRRSADFSASTPKGINFVQPEVDLAEMSQTKDIEFNEDRLVNTAVLYRLTENLTVLEKAHPELAPLVAALGTRIRTFSNRNVDVDKSSYVEMLLSNAVPRVKEAIQSLRGQVKLDYKHIDLVIGSQDPKIPADSTIRQLGAILIRSLHKLAEDFNSKPISETVRSRLVNEINQRAGQYDSFFSKLGGALEERASLSAHVRALNAVVKDSKVDVPQTGIQKAERLGALFDQISDAQTALRALIEVWKYMSDADRRELIGALNKDLYNYLNKQDDQDLKCLATADCGDLFKTISKSFAILPAIETFGVARIKSDLNKKAIAYMDERIQRELETALESFADVLFSKIHARIDANVNQLEQFQSSFGGEFKKRLRNYSAKEFAPASNFVSLPTAGKVRLTVTGGKLNLGPLTNPETNEANDSAWLAYTAATAKSNHSVDGATKQMLMSAIESNAIRFSGKKPTVPAAKDIQFNARNEAEKIRGLSLVGGYLAPWRESSYNQALGQITMAHLFPEYPADLLSHSIFPADAILPLVLSNTSTTMNKLQQTPSPIILMDSDHNILKSQDDSQLPVMAVIADLQNGVSTKQIDSATVATSILAYSEFLLATDHIEKVNLPLVPTDELQAGRAQIRKLIFALCNFLARVARNTEGLIGHQVSLPDLKLILINSVTIEDQALAIRAFTKASAALKNDIYRWEAISLVNRLNTNYLNTETGFYDLKTGASASLTESVEMLVALEELKGQLPEANRNSIDLIQKPTLSALSRLTKFY